MTEIPFNTFPLPGDRIGPLLEARGILLNEYAKVYMAHPGFRTEETRSVTAALCPLRELGFDTGARFADIFSRLGDLGLRPCAPSAALFLRLAYGTQPRSENTVLTGTHRAPEGSVTVLSRFLDPDDAFPRGLYLRNVDGALWLRGYVCPEDHLWGPGDIFAFEKISPCRPKSEPFPSLFPTISVTGQKSHGR